MIWAGGLAALLAAGLWLVVRGLVPVARPLRALSDDLSRPRLAPSERGGDGRWSARRQRVASRLAGTPSPRVHADLAVLGRTPAGHTLDKLGYAAVFALIAAAAVAALPLSGTPVPPATAAGVALGAAALGWCYPELELRSKAQAARRRWAQALAVYVDVVGISLAGGSGVEDALMVAARAGTGPQFEAVHDALRQAQTRRRKLWDALDELGARADVGALRELAAAVELAAESGSRIRETLLAKASAMRVRQLTEAEADAHRASETMGIAPALMAIAAVVLIGYPALARFVEG